MTDAAQILEVLIVEDDDSKIDEWNDAITAHNADAENKGFQVEHVVSKSVSDAKRKLDFHRFDAAVVDLRLQIEEGVTENNSHGNELVRHIIATQPLGVVVHTGQQSEADRDGYGVPQVQVMDKGDGLDQVFEWLNKHMDMFLQLRMVRAAFDRETAKVFFRSIWPRWKHWTDGRAGNGIALADIVARHVVAHVHDALLSAGGDSTHPEESYFVPPLKSRLDTGDLLDRDGKTWIVVSPRCDLANEGKVNTILLAACDDISGKWRELTDSKKEKECAKLIQHERSPKQHFLFPLRDLNSNQRGPWMIQFHDILALPAEQALKELPSHRFASLSPLFVPSLVERFGGYFSRIGTPSFSSD
ncbi:MAG: histidine kinase [Rhodanobacter sp.]